MAAAGITSPLRCVSIRYGPFRCSTATTTATRTATGVWSLTVVLDLASSHQLRVEHFSHVVQEGDQRAHAFVDPSYVDVLEIGRKRSAAFRVVGITKRRGP